MTIFFQPEQRGPGDPEQQMYVLIWDNMSFYRAAQVCGQTKTRDMTDFIFPMDYLFLDIIYISQFKKKWI
jgi:hypothetical protein